MNIPTDVSDDLIEELCGNIRVKLTEKSEAEIKGLVLAAYHDMSIRGVHVISEDDSLTVQAVRLYCKAHYGYDKDTERFNEAYQSLADSMSLSKEYGKGGEEDGA